MAVKFVKTVLLFSNAIDVDHRNNCMFTNKGHLSSLLWVLIGVLGKFQPLIQFDPYDHYVACWFTLTRDEKSTLCAKNGERELVTHR